MNSSGRFLIRAIALAACLTPSVAVAADVPASFEAVIRPYRAGLIREDGVAAELKLTTAQRQDIDAKLTREESAYVAAVGKLPAKGEARDAELAKLNQATIERANAAVLDGLTEPQVKRLRQIDLQLRGPAAFVDPEVKDRLGLSGEQVAKFAKLKDEFDIKSGRLSREARGVDTTKRIPDTELPSAGQQSLAGATPASLKAEYALSAKNVLTSAQLDKWYELIGDPYPNPLAKKK